MIEEDHLAREIYALISLKKEGDYWDFKEKHHDKTGELVKDVLCLANTVRHKGDRYIIFGVNNSGGFAVLTEPRKTQADIISTLAKAAFSGNTYPDVYLKPLTIGEHALEVLVIKDKAEKPYYLQKEYSKDGVHLHAGTVYARVRDANTASDHVASDADIEKMWRERFGLSSTAIERFKIYLADFENWKLENETLYYAVMPEFTIRPDHDDGHGLDYNPEWARGEVGSHLNSGNNAYYMVAYYHQTPLRRSIIINFDGGKKRMVAPDYSPYGAGRIYYYLADSFDYALQQNYARSENIDHSKGIMKINRTCRDTFSIPVFRDQYDLQTFLNFANKPFPGNPEPDQNKQNALFGEALEKYKEYRKRSHAPK